MIKRCKRENRGSQPNLQYTLMDFYGPMAALFWLLVWKRFINSSSERALQQAHRRVPTVLNSCGHGNDSTCNI